MSVDKLIGDLFVRHGNASNHNEGDLFVTENCVCKSAAGYYIGSWCIEVIEGQWFPQPYERLTHYMTEAEANVVLGEYQ